MRGSIHQGDPDALMTAKHFALFEHLSYIVMTAGVAPLGVVH